MCWNARVSLNTFAFALFIAFLAYINRKYHDIDMRLIIFMLVFSSIQLVEAGVWTYIDNPQMNKLFTHLIIIILIVELFAAGNVIDNKNLKHGYFTGVIICILIYFSQYYNSSKVHSVIAKNGHLRWMITTNNYPFLYAFPILLLLPFLITMKKYYYVFIIGLITLIISVISYNKYNTIGSMWCWIVNGTWIIIFYKIIIGICK